MSKRICRYPANKLYFCDSCKAAKEPAGIYFYHYFAFMKLEQLRPEKYLKYLYLPNLIPFKRTKEILAVNPTAEPRREDAAKVEIRIFDYNSETITEKITHTVKECFPYKQNGNITWINIDGLRKADVEAVCNQYDIHPLIIEDILSINQRPKMDESENYIFCLLNMLYFNDQTQTVEQEQISIILLSDTVISFQEDAERDVFTLLREKLKNPNTKLRQRGADLLCYALLDMIVDHYFLVMEKLGERIEEAEQQIIRGTDPHAINRISHLRKELIVLKRNFIPVREIINGFIRSDSELLEDRHTKYFKDVYDHILQAIDLVENYRDVLVNMQDLHFNNMNLKLNQVMKVMAIVTCLMAPPTVIGGIFGMNFDNNVDFFHQSWGFYSAVGLMFFFPIIMLIIFKRRGWF
ncbi:MAG: magnesium/cobalt transporter CorA [Chitinophagaceae bacterium]|nr:magnesium/cobalt transporter CorA [Chitinophagaceae bacterium]